jgi:hypothetical protein
MKHTYEADAPHLPYPGTRGAPTIDGDMIHLLGGLGRLTAYRSSDGEAIWSIDVVNDLAVLRSGSHQFVSVRRRHS